MGGYVANRDGPTRIDSVDPDDVTPIAVRWAPYIRSQNRTGISNAVWSSDDGVSLSAPTLLPDEAGNVTISQVNVTVTSAPLNSTVRATCQATIDTGTQSQSVLMQVRQR